MNQLPYEYVGDELEIFVHATRWKAYWRSRLQSFIRGDVLEVGAGLGTNTLSLHNPNVTSWHCLEPDAALANQLAQATRSLPRCQVTTGTISSVGSARFDAILYIDVLEHIEDDTSELARAADRLRPGGRLIVLSPAHPFLYSPFDRAIGHFRRYTARSLKACGPAACTLSRLEYLDSVGMLASLLNRALLRQSMPTVRQIQSWDSLIVPVSRVIDPILMHRLGKSIIAVWTRK